MAFVRCHNCPSWLPPQLTIDVSAGAVHSKISVLKHFLLLEINVNAKQGLARMVSPRPDGSAPIASRSCLSVFGFAQTHLIPLLLTRLPSMSSCFVQHSQAQKQSFTLRNVRRALGPSVYDGTSGSDVDVQGQGHWFPVCRRTAKCSSDSTTRCGRATVSHFSMIPG